MTCLLFGTQFCQQTILRPQSVGRFQECVRRKEHHHPSRYNVHKIEHDLPELFQLAITLLAEKGFETEKTTHNWFVVPLTVCQLKFLASWAFTHDKTLYITGRNDMATAEIWYPLRRERGKELCDYVRNLEMADACLEWWKKCENKIVQATWCLQQE